MDRHVAHINRTGLVLVGLVLMAAGGAALARGLGAFGNGRASDPVLSDGVRRYADDHGWFWPSVGAAAVVLALFGLAWLFAQGRSRRLRGFSMEPDAYAGATRLSAKAVTDAVESDIEEYPGVQSARARLTGTSEWPRMSLSVAYEGHADVADLRRRIGDEAVRRLCATLERDTVPTVVRLRLVSADDRATVA